MIQCPCGSQKNYLTCCGLLINEQCEASSPEALMRSRYTAYTLARIDYIKKTMTGKPAEAFDEISSEKWAKQVNWKGLKILSSFMENEQLGFVEFIASFLEQGKKQSIHELSKFERIGGKWFYTQGSTPKTNKSAIKSSPLRNSSCPCGSLKKYKNCHGLTKK
ncbi:MAG: SEC-C domain-containing protein [Tatlockia sp.]|nr:SEC-C domain-containing protein [Tatlockia sp.]